MTNKQTPTTMQIEILSCGVELFREGVRPTQKYSATIAANKGAWFKAPTGQECVIYPPAYKIVTSTSKTN